MRWAFIDAKDFDAHWAGWDRLNESRGASPLLGGALMRLALEHFGDGGERMAVASEGGQVIAMLILGGVSRGAMRLFQPSQLPLGPLLSAPHISLAALSDSLGRGLPFPSILVSLTQLDPDFLPATGAAERLRVLPHIETGFIDLPDSMQNYLAGRPKKRVYEIERRLRKAGNEIGAVHFQVYRDEAQVGAFLDRFADMESAGWKGEEGTAIARGNDQQKFYIDVMRAFCRTGEARMYELFFGERSAAMQLALESSGRLYFLKTTYDERLREYGPGVSLKRFIFDTLYAGSDCRRIEFYGRIIEPQRMWITGSRRLFHANVYRNPLYARLHDLMQKRAEVAPPDAQAAVDEKPVEVRVCDSFAALSAPASVAPDNPFADLRWFAHLEGSTRIAQNDLRLYCATQGDRYFVLPMMGSMSSLAGTGTRSLTALANFYTPSFDPVSNGDAGFQRRCIERVVERLDEGAQAWDAILFQPLDTEAPLYGALKPALRRSGYLCDDFFCFGNWYLPVQGRDFAAYFAGLPSVLRHTVERSRRKLTRNHAGWVDILQLPDEHLQKGIDAFEAVYRRSWKQAEPYPDFIPSLCRVAAEAGWLRLGVLYADQQPVAAQIWLTTPEKAAIYKLAYDESYAKKLSAGSVLSAAMFEHALNVDKVKEIDYLVGDDPYKRDWMSHRRERRGIIAFNPRRPRALLAAGRHYVGVLLGRLRGGLMRAE